VIALPEVLTKLAIIGLLFHLPTLIAGDPSPPPDTGTSIPQTNAFPFRQVGPGIFVLGKVTLNKPRGTVSFPATVNQREGTVEYAVVTRAGKTHESVFKTDASPDHIHMAMLLLGARPANTNLLPADPSSPLPGDKVTIDVSWQLDGRELRHPLESCIVTTNDHKTLTRGPWIYNGSYVDEAGFMAQADGSIISIHTDPAALINNPRKGRQNDDLQHANTAALTLIDGPLQIIITLQTARPTTDH
jgi:hypothetical protein